MLPRHLERIVNSNGGVVYRRAVEEQFSNDQLLERILSTENIKLAWKQVRANKGAPGIDGITVEDFPLTFRECWPEIRSGKRGTRLRLSLKGLIYLLLFNAWKFRNRMAVLVRLEYQQCWIE
jgi:hypothetical protein